MAGQIRLTPDDMRGRSREYHSEGEKFQETINNMERLLNQLQEEWEGKASEAFKARFEELKPAFNQTKELIDDIAQKLEGTANQLENLDLELSKQINQ